MTERHPGERVSVAELRARKGSAPIVCLTAYTTPVARLLDPHVDVLLVGDSLAMVVYGLPNTQLVSLDTMIRHGAAVVRGSESACVTVDLPRGSFEEGAATAYESAERILAETGAQAVKMEGGSEMAGTVAHLVSRGVPVMGHVGLLPQRVADRNGYRVQGTDPADRDRILADARAIADAGAFAIVVESTVEPLARSITEEVSAPTIGIGASPACDGQILVVDDVIGLFRDFEPRYVRRYAEVGEEIEHAVAAYAADVTARRFPAAEHCYPLKPGGGEETSG